MRLIDADVLLDNIRRDSKKAIDDGDKVGSFWLGYIAGLVIKQPTIQPEVLACGNGELIAKPEPQWIPVSERLPETGVEVLTYDEALNYIEIQTVSDGRWENQRGDWQDLDDIAAWMPLPEAYKPNK